MMHNFNNRGDPNGYPKTEERTSLIKQVLKVIEMVLFDTQFSYDNFVELIRNMEYRIPKMWLLAAILFVELWWWEIIRVYWDHRIDSHSKNQKGKTTETNWHSRKYSGKWN